MLFRLEPQAIVMLVPVLLFSLTVHEFAHAFTAYKLGDHTAARQGRLTLNPLAHLDPMGTLLLFFVGFGYAKPVPVDLRNLKHPRRDDSIIAAAGPLSNLAMAIIVGLSLRFGLPWLDGLARSNPNLQPTIHAVISMAIMAMFINLALCVLNSLPLYPLDGSHVMENSLPPAQAMRYRESARYSIFILMAIFFIDPIADIVFAPVGIIANLILGSSYF